MNSKNPVTGAGFLTGLATIFLPVTQSLPVQVSTGQIKVALVSGMGIIIGSLVHHGVITATEVSTAKRDLPAIEANPLVQQAATVAESWADKWAQSIEHRLATVEHAQGPATTLRMPVVASDTLSAPFDAAGDYDHGNSDTPNGVTSP
jgi:hypothetical protein